MKTLFLFLLTCFVSTGAMVSAATMHNPLVGFIVAGISWLLFARYVGRKKRTFR